MQKNIPLEIISSLLVLLFVYAAWSKLLNYDEFKNQLQSSPLIHSFAVPVSIFLPLTEGVAAILLCFQQTQRTGLVLTFILMTLFTFYIIYMLLFEKHLPCSCGGVLKRLGWKQHLVFNIVFTAMALTGMIIEKKKNHFKNIAGGMRSLRQQVS